MAAKNLPWGAQGATKCISHPFPRASHCPPIVAALYSAIRVNGKGYATPSQRLSSYEMDEFIRAGYLCVAWSC